MSLDVAALYDSVKSHAMQLGIFESVNTHEPKSAPSLAGITASVILGPITTVKSSGLASASVRVEFLVRLQSSMLAEPQDDIDPNLLTAVSTTLAAYCGDFDLGGTARAVDILGMDGPGLSAVPGYLEQDKKLYRVLDITLPVIVNDAWSEIA
jgi:hypothetical protein